MRGYLGESGSEEITLFAADVALDSVGVVDGKFVHSAGDAKPMANYLPLDLALSQDL